jgi:hypothetical protein
MPAPIFICDVCCKTAGVEIQGKKLAKSQLGDVKVRMKIGG